MHFFVLLLVAINIISPLAAQWCDDSDYEGYSSCPSPEWIASAYIAPTVFYERLHISRDRNSIVDFAGITEGTNLDGVLYGVNGGYIYKTCWGLYAQLDSTYAQGDLKDHNKKNRFDWDFDIQGLLGYELCVCDLCITPYIGIGYSFNRQRFNEETFDDRRLELCYHIYYIPVGIRFNYLVTPCFEVGFNFKATPQADSSLNVSMFKGVRWELSNTTGYFVEVPLTWNIYYTNYVWKTVLIPFWQRTVYGQSEKSDKAFIVLSSPKQTYDDFGLRLEMGTCF